MIRVARVCVFVCVGDYLSVQDCTAAQVLTSTWSHVLEKAKRRACSKRFTPFPPGTDSLATVVRYSVVRRDIFPRSFGSRGGHCQPQVTTSTLLTDPAAARWRTNSSFTKKLVWTCQTEAQRARKSTNRTDFIFFFNLYDVRAIPSGKSPLRTLTMWLQSLKNTLLSPVSVSAGKILTIRDEEMKNSYRDLREQSESNRILAWKDLSWYYESELNIICVI